VQIKSNQLSAFRLFQYFQHVLINLGAYNRWANEHIVCQVKVQIVLNSCLLMLSGFANQASSPAIPVAQQRPNGPKTLPRVSRGTI
jgi:hypothetical protein